MINSFPILSQWDPTFATAVVVLVRCTYAHSLEELHPASPDLPRVEVKETNALAEQQMLGYVQHPMAMQRCFHSDGDGVCKINETH